MKVCGYSLTFLSGHVESLSSCRAELSDKMYLQAKIHQLCCCFQWQHNKQNILIVFTIVVCVVVSRWNGEEVSQLFIGSQWQRRLQFLLYFTLRLIITFSFPSTTLNKHFWIHPNCSPPDVRQLPSGFSDWRLCCSRLVLSAVPTAAPSSRVCPTSVYSRTRRSGMDVHHIHRCLSSLHKL